MTDRDARTARPVPYSVETLRAQFFRLVAGMAGSETLPLTQARGRVLATPVVAGCPIPPHDHAVMDGYALGTRRDGRFRLVPAGRALAPDEASTITTGAPVPAGTAAVSLITHADAAGDVIDVRRNPVRDNVRRLGEEAAPGDLLIAGGTVLGGRHLALIATGGHGSVTVRPVLRLALLESNPSGEPTPQGLLAEAMVASPAVRVARRTLTAASLRAALTAADLVLCVGDSLGAEDGPLARLLTAAGRQVGVVRAALKPAKPLVFSPSEPDRDTAVVLGLSGSPYAVAVVLHLFASALIAARLGLTATRLPIRPERAAFARDREPGRAEALPARLVPTPEGLRVELAGSFGRTTALCAAEGLAMIDATSGPVRLGDPVGFLPIAS